MVNQLSILLGALIIGLAIFMAQLVEHYQIATSFDSGGAAVVWRVNTRTGQVQACQFWPGTRSLECRSGLPTPQ